MPVPNLTHPVPCWIQSLDRGETFFDEDLREPIQSEVHGPTIICPGQVMWVMDQKMSLSNSGVDEDSDGYVLFRFIDLNAKGIVLKREDRFIRLGKQDVDVYVIGLQPIAHYPDQGGATMIKAFFRDKNASRQNKGK